MEALGLIETRGLLATIESADAMLKAAEVSLLERTFVGGGLVTITVTGDVAAVKASVDAGAAAVTRLGPELLVSQHVIPRPHSDLSETILPPEPLCERKAKEETGEPEAEEPPETEPERQEETEEEPEVPEDVSSESEPESEEDPAQEEEEDTSAPVAAEMHKADMDRLVEEKGLDKALAVIEQCKVVKLRNLAREYEDFGIAGRLISKANKTVLLEEFKSYYS